MMLQKKFSDDTQRKDWQKIFHDLRRYVQISFEISEKFTTFDKLFKFCKENTAFAKTINTLRYWRSVASAAVCFGHRLAIRASPINHRTSVPV